MKALDLKQRIESLCTHVTFEFNGKSCGIDPFSQDDFEMWCGDMVMIAKSIDEVMSVPFFDGSALTDIVDDVTNLEI